MNQAESQYQAGNGLKQKIWRPESVMSEDHKAEEEREDKLIAAVNAVANLGKKDKTQIGKKNYTMVHTRVTTFRAHLGMNGRIKTEIVDVSDRRVLVKATIFVWCNEGWREIANDFAEEYRGTSAVNKTSAIENCCTSAIGRALSAAGLSGGEYASDFEVKNAIENKQDVTELLAEEIQQDIMTPIQTEEILGLIAETGVEKAAVLKWKEVNSISELSQLQYAEVKSGLEKKLKEQTDAA
tara:strand:- start:761 stop:1480 length:720 start_codon:yes stop_codon:yes gene_type:complete